MDDGSFACMVVGVLDEGVAVVDELVVVLADDCEEGAKKNGRLAMVHVIDDDVVARGGAGECPSMYVWWRCGIRGAGG